VFVTEFVLYKLLVCFYLSKALCSDTTQDDTSVVMVADRLKREPSMVKCLRLYDQLMAVSMVTKFARLVEQLI